MKLKEVDCTANIAWSPASHYPVYLAAGTAAQQLDATFSTTASLELYNMNLTDKGKQMERVGEIETDSRFYKVVWGAHGIDDKSSASGLLMGGAEQGQLFIWDAAKIITRDDPLVHKFSKHSGPVTTLDINPFQINLVASGAGESEIFIWDLNSPDKPMTPGAKAQPAHDVTCLAWNRQVQHILASSHGGNCIVWDLRKNEPIIKIRDSMSHIKCGVICWHPEVATQVCIASEDDHTPVIQLWDLRSATSPLKVFESHQRGILSMSWCPADPDLLLSSGKDNRILCWNPNSEFKMGEVVYELPTGNQWSFDVQWCPRNPSVISSCSFDGHVTLYSVMGESSLSQMSNKADGTSSFDPFSQSLPQCGDAVLKKPPRWIRRTVGASFAFGGKLVSFGNVKLPSSQQHAKPDRPIFISQVVTETELVARSMHLEKTLADGYFTQFCDEKIAGSKDLNESTVWSFLKVNFEPDNRQQYLKLLGYSHSSVKEQVKEALTKDKEMKSDQLGPPADTFSDDADIGTDNISPFDNIVSTSTEPSRLGISVNNGSDGLLTRSLLTANFEAAVDVCLSHGRMAEALVLAIAGGPELLGRTQKAFFDANRSSVDQLMWAIVTQNFESVVRTCDLNNWKEALAVILTYTAGEEFTKLCNMLGNRLKTECEGELALNSIICYIVAGNVEQLVASWSQTVSDEASCQTLQDLVEKVMILKNGVELSMHGLASSTGSYLAEKLSQYADVLASQGCIKTAMNYLNCVSMEDRSVALLVDRLSQSVGLLNENSSAVKKPFTNVSVLPDSSQQLSVARQQQQQQHQQSVVNSDVQHAGSPVEHNVETTFMNNGYSSHAGQPISNMLLQQDSNIAELNRVAPLVSTSTSSSLSRGLPKKYVQPAVEPVAPNYAPYAAYPQHQQYDSHAQLPQPYMQTVNSAPYYHSSEVAPTVSNSPVYQHQSLAGAWNDPPVVKDNARQPYIGFSSAPIRFDGKILNPAEYQPVQPPAQESNAEQVRTVEPPPVVPAPSTALPPSLPQEHRILQDVFNRLVQICTSHGAHNPQIKKKLEDVLRKLDHLYTQLRLGKLSPSTINGLHQIVEAVQQYDYQTALAYHAQIVSVGSFTEISPFMPGIKVLIQTALQLQVYI